MEIPWLFLLGLTAVNTVLLIFLVLSSLILDNGEGSDLPPPAISFTPKKGRKSLLKPEYMTDRQAAELELREAEAQK